jgi:hypothetical protein
MSVYMAAQTAISFSFHTDIEIITKDKQKLALVRGPSGEWEYHDTGGGAGRVDIRPGERGCDGRCGGHKAYIQSPIIPAF